ncbi:MAG TPA: GIY-YIG nuclease family protein, partial [Gaiellaceae bacterium]
AFLDAETMRLTGRRVDATSVDTLSLSRRLLGRRPANLAALSHHFVTSARPCHRALPDAEATAEILLCLIGLAQERGARTVGDLVDLAATKPRRVHAKRSLTFGAPTTAGVYLFRDVHEQVLYVGRARDLRARLRSYFRSDRQRPAVEAALGALHRIEWRETGSELEAGLEELRLIRELRPPANARSVRPDRYVYLRRRGESVVCSQTPGALGPLRSRRRANLAARALQSVEWETPSGALPALRTKLCELARELRFEDAARMRDGINALEYVVRELDELDRLRRIEAVLVVGARAVWVAKGQVVSVRPWAGTSDLEWQAGLALVACAEPSVAPEAADELSLVAATLRRPPPELEVVPLNGWRSSANARWATAGASWSSTA